MPIMVPFKWLLPELRGAGRGGGRMWDKPHCAARASAPLPPAARVRLRSPSCREPKRLVQGLQLGSHRTKSRPCSSGSRATCFASPSPSRAHHAIYSFVSFKSLSPGLRPRPRALRPCPSLREASFVAAEMFPAPATADLAALVSALPLGPELGHGGPRPGVRGPL